LAEPLRLPDEEAIVVGYVSDFYALLRAIDETMPSDAFLYLERRPARNVETFLNQRQASDQPTVEPNTLWPKPHRFHLPLVGTNLTELRLLAEEHAEPEVADHLVVYRDHAVLLWAHDAGDGYVALSRSLPKETVDRFRATLAGVLRHDG
jgi:hypothetical protein